MSGQKHRLEDYDQELETKRTDIDTLAFLPALN